ncbi:Similar to S.cerevisiae protein BMT2 (Nucleolar S-adenosylmethionine-dependent rRNA methyltransferase) [Malassezia sympodialis ATCC 42132]|uniref:25S rRNA adenine-N(1) methyltransferase n=1 Tax=Malassezia sympodialis (strain ATCC 42132) TaxID=1230383 RepID=A0A1M8ACF0_MALS4|nr:Similar to S.cerevisiae protein BMT2 (Nucleolar S-adenosylmethionine-dependent rRNA methyltransferase) [Malassezia sympodialis ATCC 42132]
MADRPAAPRRRARLVRPRGKRGGAKHRKSSKAGAAVSEHAKVIAQYHALEKKIARAPPDERAQLVAEQRALGGLAAYQDQSSTGGAVVRGGESGKWCVKVLKELWPLSRKVRLLDVGAIAGTAYAAWPGFVETTSMDLHPRADHVIACDFFDFPVPADDAHKFDVVGLSLVLNFVGDLHRRGAMLVHAHQYLRPGGYVYVVLPLACVANSRYMSHQHFRSLVRSVGYDVVRQEDSQRLTRWLLQQRDPQATEAARRDVASLFWDGTVFKKRELRAGAQRNNFCILYP